jgi:hypothetical protein
MTGPGETDPDAARRAFGNVVGLLGVSVISQFFELGDEAREAGDDGAFMPMPDPEEPEDEIAALAFRGDTVEVSYAGRSYVLPIADARLVLDGLRPKAA